ncbi:hypothetical protein GOBAR_AA26888 [Gossypium barbadense]|uniref:Uncharacterized protein n=1 Tax=Gossypium barbadense TaxID=3634 RepID=A0A2P5WRU1_GOSBA|nr:hypothetical protein GOBAR_AA26888 [Gossypium barbadense]
MLIKLIVGIGSVNSLHHHDHAIESRAHGRALDRVHTTRGDKAVRYDRVKTGKSMGMRHARAHKPCSRLIKYHGGGHPYTGVEEANEAEHGHETQPSPPTRPRNTGMGRIPNAPEFKKSRNTHEYTMSTSRGKKTTVPTSKKRNGTTSSSGPTTEICHPFLQFPLGPQ